ncbi:hypothetical protein AOCH_003222 [Aspergillus ochraceoroseus]|uniref:F-box domain protein n=1 Tax=Aspergillus ochraceoroseus TaxID=138278 RepID=A0A0F8WVB0_9EURO|nr:hypothetical protein AOCH_003222 [Aspergillus ochraceoroseus]
MTENPRHIEDLADELISDILSFLLGAEYLSNAPSPVNTQDLSPKLNGRATHVYGEESELDRFRLVCKRFLRISTPRKFPRFVLRFSLKGFQRLEELLHMQLACHVRYFTYMVRPFYQGSGWPHILSKTNLNDFPAAQIHQTRLQDQLYILDEDHDLALLRRAIAAFSSLQQVKLLRLQDRADEELLDYIHERSLDGMLGMDWAPACARAVTALGASLLASNCTSVRFVGPQISPEATVRLLQVPSATLSAVGARLTCLDITFHTKMDITLQMESLSRAFHDFFLAAKNLTTIHLGFATNAPLDLPLEHIFHCVQWKRLRTLSIQGWRLGSEEIIALIRRHRRQLCDIRLISIYLREGDLWRDVLSVLRNELDRVERIDLREINYASHIDTSTANGNGHSHGNGVGNGTTLAPESSIGIGNMPHPLSIIVNRTNPDQVPRPPPSPPPPVLNTDHLSFVSRGTTRRSFPASTLEILSTLSANDLGDNGVSVRHEQRLFWEAWVLSSPRKTMRRLD